MSGQAQRSRALASSLPAPHFLYRCYDTDGLLVYIGCSADPMARMECHRASRTRASRLIRKHAVRIEVDSDAYYGRGAARDAEAVAIHAEQPLFNVQHRCIPIGFIRAQIRDYSTGQPVRQWPESPLCPSARVLQANAITGSRS